MKQPEIGCSLVKCIYLGDVKLILLLVVKCFGQLAPAVKHEQQLLPAARLALLQVNESKNTTCAPARLTSAAPYPAPPPSHLVRALPGVLGERRVAAGAVIIARLLQAFLSQLINQKLQGGRTRGARSGNMWFAQDFLQQEHKQQAPKVPNAPLAAHAAGAAAPAGCQAWGRYAACQGCCWHPALLLQETTRNNRLLQNSGSQHCQCSQHHKSVAQQLAAPNAPASRLYMSSGLPACVRAAAEASADDTLLYEPSRPVSFSDAPLPSSAPTKKSQQDVR